MFVDSRFHLACRSHLPNASLHVTYRASPSYAFMLTTSVTLTPLAWLPDNSSLVAEGTYRPNPTTERLGASIVGRYRYWYWKQLV